MDKLIVGNGLNLAANNSNMQPDKIANSFFSCVYKVLPLLSYLTGYSKLESITHDKFVSEINYEIDENIEKVADKTVKFLSSLYKQFTDTDLWIISQFIKPLAINAIFYDEDNLISTEITKDSSLFQALNKYSEIYTLNYYESWDTGKCNFLHGKYNPVPVIENDKKALLLYEGLFCKRRLKDPIVEDILTCLSRQYHIIKLSHEEVCNIAFVGESYDKARSICLYPSDKLFPSDMLFAPNKSTPLYNNFTLADNDVLSVFGMSPYGDKMLIDKIKAIKNVKIYVHNKCGSIQTRQWGSLVPNAEIIDSQKFYA